MSEIIDLTDHVSYMAHGFGDRPILPFLHGEDYSLAVDGGCSPRHIREFLDALGKERKDALKGVLLTHGHWDHISGLSEYHLPVYCTTEILPILRKADTDFSEETLKKKLNEGKIIQFGYDNINLEFEGIVNRTVEIPEPVVFTGGVTFDLGEVHVAYAPLKSCHCSHCTSIYVEEDGVLFAGDSLWPNMETNHWFYSLSDFLQLKKDLQSFHPGWIVDSHDRPRKAEYIYRWMDEVAEEVGKCLKTPEYEPKLRPECALEFDDAIVCAIKNAVE